LDASGTMEIAVSQLGGLLGGRAGQPLPHDDVVFRTVLDVLPTAVYVTDTNGVITYFNEAAATLWGHRPEIGSDAWCGSWKLYWPDGRALPHDECPMAIALKERRPVYGLTAIAERPDGSRVPFAAHPTPLYDASGAFIGAVNMLVDITDRQRAVEDGQRLAAIVESSEDAIISKDLNGIITSWNRGAERLFGYTVDEIVGRPVLTLIPADLQDEEHRIIDSIRRGERIGHYETVRRCKDGSLVEISLTVSPLKNAEGRIIGASKIARDITALRRAQQQQKLLVHEMKHRIKNTLATVQAIASQTLQGATREDRQAFVARLQALAGAHDLLTNEDWQRAALRDIVERALQPFQEKHQARIVTDGPHDISLDPHKSSLVAMALHELATNAVKYGALSNGSGQVRVSWEVAGDGRLHLAWAESGGPRVTPPARKGFGSLLIGRALRSEFGHTQIDFDPQGVTCTLEVPLEQRPDSAAA
jgi:two-component system, chemotaxis family, CheB/CheR fusion protein